MNNFCRFAFKTDVFVVFRFHMQKTARAVIGWIEFSGNKNEQVDGNSLVMDHGKTNMRPKETTFFIWGGGQRAISSGVF
jgi:hypothetical protein